MKSKKMLYKTTLKDVRSLRLQPPSENLRRRWQVSRPNSTCFLESAALQRLNHGLIAVVRNSPVAIDGVIDRTPRGYGEALRSKPATLPFQIILRRQHDLLHGS